MDKSNPKIIIMDLDGTLLTDDRIISEYTLSMLEKCKKKNILIGIATARSRRSSKRFTDLLSPDIMILDGGALAINKENDVLYNKKLSQKTSDGIIKECLKNHNIQKISIHTDDKVYVNYDDQYREYIDLSKPFKHRTIKITLKTIVNISLGEIAEKYPECKLMNFSGENYYTFAHKNAEKFDAIKAVSKKEKIQISDIVCFGDDYNDIEMVKNCGIGVAMENGIDEIKKIAKYICGKNNENGIGRWIEKNIL